MASNEIIKSFQIGRFSIHILKRQKDSIRKVYYLHVTIWSKEIWLKIKKMKSRQN